MVIELVDGHNSLDHEKSNYAIYSGRAIKGCRKATRKLIPKQTDDFMKNVLDKRQLKPTNLQQIHLYGQCGARTSTFSEKDADRINYCNRTTKLLTYAKRVIEEVYGDTCDVKLRIHMEMVKSQEQSMYMEIQTRVFFTFNLEELDGTPIRGKKLLKLPSNLQNKQAKLHLSF